MWKKVVHLISLQDGDDKCCHTANQFPSKHADKTLLWCRSIPCRRRGCFTTHRLITIIYNGVREMPTLFKSLVAFLCFSPKK